MTVYPGGYNLVYVPSIASPVVTGSLIVPQYMNNYCQLVDTSPMSSPTSSPMTSPILHAPPVDFNALIIDSNNNLQLSTTLDTNNYNNIIQSPYTSTLSCQTGPTPDSPDISSDNIGFIPPKSDSPKFLPVNKSTFYANGIPLPTEYSSYSSPFYRNFYHNIEFLLHEPMIQAKYEGCRVYISDQVGYGGNAKKFCNNPSTSDETALLLEAQVLDHQFNPLPQCSCCKDYFQSRFYFANNPQCKDRLVLIKSNVSCLVKEGSLVAQIKVMCCSKHHNNNHLVIHLWLRDYQTNEVIMSSVLSSFVKQWKRSKTT
ncbi:hypothetical protein SAMD00019534_123800 [Acytostelium subglobosum LB1]|uniref:hypothetical protein n=1 Tax=Acytostelium subglobosum LB1 TaxID=1410327 RepID=UPI00064504F5|nr:hypothetical protein SAMD00019534_123800 [Acytostelium subglobosum LB1]GAM29204.1 hypothetical protein SAMD00019534_123800 [Acytostelium subglobosum LB1]|eukprot:XP_012747895.1 hypothetical protein SAMD00019534_123800 [Acytostelium subglobosum LB1]